MAGQVEAYEVVFHSSEWEPLDEDTRTFRLYRYDRLPNWVDLEKEHRRYFLIGQQESDR